MKIDVINPVRLKLRPTPGFRVRVFDKHGMVTAAAFDVAGFSTDSDSIELLNRARFCGRCLDPKSCACRWSVSYEPRCTYTCSEDDGQCESCREFEQQGRLFADPPAELLERDIMEVPEPGRRIHSDFFRKDHKPDRARGAEHDSWQVRLRVTRRRAARQNAGKRCA